MDTDKNIAELQEAKRETGLILVVDGDVADSFYTSILLQRLEYDIYSAKSAEDALAIMDIAAPSLILTEIALPQLNGIELLKKIKRDPRTGSIPVIIHTRGKNPEYEESCRSAGCAKYLIKPVDPNTLYAAVQSATQPAPRRVIRFKTRLGLIVEDETTSEWAVDAECITYLSESGIFISTADPQPPGTVLPIVFSLKNIKIRVEGIVLYSLTKRNRPFGEYGMGLKFLHISEADKKLIRTFIMEQLTKNIAPQGKSSPPL
jgi:CheY-like chemotaxis protein